MRIPVVDMNYRVRIPSMRPMFPAYTKVHKGFKDVVKYSMPVPSRSIWEWFERQWDDWVDEIACWWIARRKIITITKEIIPVENIFGYSSYEIELQDLVRTILKYNAEYKCITGQPIKYILVGQNIWLSLKSQITPMTFRFPTELIDSRHAFLFYGCQIVLVPNMEGMVFLPELPKPIGN